jgi:hypothetical protein
MTQEDNNVIQAFGDIVYGKKLQKPEIDRSEIKRALRYALRPAPGAKYNKLNWPVWLEDRLTTLSIYGYSDKSEYTVKKAVSCLRQYGEGFNYDVIARNTHLNKGTVKNYIGDLLDWIIDSTPPSLLAKVPLEHTDYRLGGCTHCRGDLLYDRDEGEYWCLCCGRRYDDHNNPMTKISLEKMTK